MIKFLKILFFTSLYIKNIYTQKFLFSVIISIYNAGRYLNDSVGSVLNQTIGKDNIQIILVNDGSTDETEEICLYYKNKYPINIIYIKIDHSGVSVGRNIGIRYAKGKYINFLDADDKWDIKAFKFVLIFFKFYKNIYMVSCRMIFFEERISFHPLDYKFYGSRVANLTNEYNCIQLSSSSSFFKYSFIRRHKFKERVFNGEDTLFINSLLLYNPLIGLLKEAIYYYRKRVDSSSTIQNKFENEDYYNYTIKSVDHYLAERSILLYNRIVPFIQFYIAYNTLFRIVEPSYKYLEKMKLKKYYELIENNLRKIDDKYILEQKILSLDIKLLALSKKYKRDIRNDIILNNDSFIYMNYPIMNIQKCNNIIVMRILNIRNNILHLEGKDNLFLPRGNYFYYCKLDDKIYYPKYFDYSGYDLITMYGIERKGRIVTFDISIGKNKTQTVQFFLSYKGINIEIFPSMGWLTHIPNIINGYYNSADFILRIINRRIIIYKYDKILEDLFEREYCGQLKNMKKFNLIKLRNNYIKYRNNKKDKMTKIWIISDKLNLAGDNGEYFFRYLKKKNPIGINFYFLLNKNCSEYNRLKSLGNILEFGSELHFDIFLKSDKIISSVFEEWVINPFSNDYRYMRDLIHFDFIFIQHGIIKDDLSKYLNRFRTNISLFITSSEKEYKSILNSNYGYNENNVILTGLPRFDNLQRLHNLINKEKIVLILPTWRMYIKGTYDSKSYKSIYSKSFNLTKFYAFYNNLINNDELLKNMENLNYTGIICLHPYFSNQWLDFNQNKLFSTRKFCDYQNLILKSSLLVTDYSSVFFDFAYLKKPIVYTHFDYVEYRNNHYQNGYFNYLKNGFGPVCYDFNCSIKQIILKIKNGCYIEKIYLQRIKNFFKYNDEKNNERLFHLLINSPNNIGEIYKNRFNIFIILALFVYFFYKIYYIKL